MAAQRFADKLSAPMTSPQTIAIPLETAPGEHRVALVPESVKKLIQAGYAVSVQGGAGTRAGFSDDAYRAAGASIGDAVANADLVLRVLAPNVAEAERLRSGAVLLGSLMPLRNLQVMRALAARGVIAFSTDAIPRTTRAQAMDTLSSQANIAGYRGVLLAEGALPKYFPMLMTAAGMVPAAKVFVIGAGVAGLQAIATARRLGASVTATDVRPEVKEQIESVGAKYVGIELKQDAAAGGGYARELSAEDQARQRQLLVEQCAIVDVVITTALIVGVFAPKLIARETVEKMQPGSIIVDLAADGGGNCELSKPGETVVAHGVTIMAPLNVAGAMPTHASTLFSRNLTAFIQAFTKDKAFVLDLDDDIQKGALITHDGKVVSARVAEALSK